MRFTIITGVLVSLNGSILIVYGAGIIANHD